jgi:HEAT repeat protein
VFRRFAVLLALCALAPEAVRAQGANRGGQQQGKAREQEEQKQLQRINDLKRELRELPSKSPGGSARPTDQKRIFTELARINHPQAARALVGFAEDPDYAALREELLQILSKAPSADEAQVSRLMRTHMAPDDPARRTARGYLLDVAKRRRRDEWLDALFDMGTTEDRFLAVQAMGDIGSVNALDRATTLLKDKSWKAEPSGLVSCGTIAMSVRNAEGQEAAGLLLLLAKDPRFGPSDAVRVREATRLWHQTDLRSYVDLNDLADRDPLRRREAATFLGTIGLESARAPLVRVAFNAHEVPEVRAAAAAALGGLRIAKEDLAMRLGALLSDPEPPVRRGAADGLGRLKVREAAAAFVSMVGGSHDAEARAALSRLTSLPPETDWKKWLQTNFPGK